MNLIAQLLQSTARSTLADVVLPSPGAEAVPVGEFSALLAKNVVPEPATETVEMPEPAGVYPAAGGKILPFPGGMELPVELPHDPVAEQPDEMATRALLSAPVVALDDAPIVALGVAPAEPAPNVAVPPARTDHALGRISAVAQPLLVALPVTPSAAPSTRLPSPPLETPLPVLAALPSGEVQPAPRPALQMSLAIRAIPAAPESEANAQAAVHALNTERVAARPERQTIALLEIRTITQPQARLIEVTPEPSAIAVAERVSEIFPRPLRSARPEQTESPLPAAVGRSGESAAQLLAAPAATVLPAVAPAAAPLAPAPMPPSVEIVSSAPRMAETPLQPQDFDTLVQRLTDAREAARPGHADLHVRHREFGQVVMQLELTEQQLRVALGSRDAGFVQAAQAAIAERGLPAITESVRAEGLAQRQDNGAALSGQQNSAGGNAALSNPQSSGRDERGASGEHARRNSSSANTRRSDDQSDAQRRDSGLYA